MSKPLDLSKNVHDLIEQYPELKDVMVEIGFKDITKPMALNTVGKIMTIPKGCVIKGFNIPEVLRKLEDAGFEPTGNRPGAAKADAPQGEENASQNAGQNHMRDESVESAESSSSSREEEKKDNQDLPKGAPQTEEERNALIKSYITRLSNGEDLESVRADFVANFSDVDAMEIVKAEQAMISDGVPLEKVQSLCDVHSALFHGATREEKIENAEKAVQESMVKSGQMNYGFEQTRADGNAYEKASSDQAGASVNTVVQKADDIRRPDETAEEYARRMAASGQDRKQAAVRLSYTVNHPVYVFRKENKAIAKHLEATRKALNIARLAEDGTAKQEANGVLLEELRQDRKIALHYSKKGDLLYPLLASKYEIVGPSNVMWGVDDEIRDEFRYVAAGLPKPERADKWYKRIDDVLTRAEEMIYKEKNILLPLCAGMFTEDEWRGISRDLQDYDPCFTEEFPIWDEAKDLKRPEPAIEGNEVRFPVGHLNAKQLNAMLNTIPLELTFIDANDTNRYFNQQKTRKFFKRPDAAIDREVYFCHSAKVEPMVRAVIADLKAGVRDSRDIWMMKNGKPALVRYMAVRDEDGTYEGTMEVVQIMDFAEKHFHDVQSI